MDPRASGWASGERERHNVDGHESGGGQNIEVSVRSLSPSHTQTLSNPFRTVAIKWKVHILLKKSSCVFIIVSLWCCRWQYNITPLQSTGQIDKNEVSFLMAYQTYLVYHYKMNIFFNSISNIMLFNVKTILVKVL